MKGRIAAIAFLLGSLSTGVTWLTLQPVLTRLLGGALRGGPVETALALRVRSLLPFLLTADLLLVSLVCYLVLEFAIERPLRRTEATIEQLGRLQLELPMEGGGGPLLSRVQAALSRMAESLRQERALNQAQLQALRRSHEELSQAQTELVASERLATVGRLAAGVAHEVGNPLSGILGYLSLVRARSSGAEVRGYLERIESELLRIDGIVRGLLELGRPAAPTLRAVELAPQVESCLRLMEASPELARVQVERVLVPGVFARTDPGALTQVLINLLLNAAQAMGGQGRVRVTVQPAGAEVQLHVDDEGPGLTPQVLARLFEPFFTTKDPGAGTGLGLAVSRHLVQGMGGRLTAENLPGVGARFTITLAAAATEPGYPPGAS